MYYCLPARKHLGAAVQDKTKEPEVLYIKLLSLEQEESGIFLDIISTSD